MFVDLCVCASFACGQAEVAIGNEWNMTVELPPVSFGVGRPVRPEMVDDINTALDHDVMFEIPENYRKGQGDSELVPCLLVCVFFCVCVMCLSELFFVLFVVV